MTEAAKDLTNESTQTNHNISNDASPGNNEAPKLWAGKYKSVEDLETAALNKDQEFMKLHNEHRMLKENHEKITKVPDKYDIPTGVELRESELRHVQAMAKNASLNQSQFENLVREVESRSKDAKAKYHERLQNLGEEKYNVIKDYVSKNYPARLHQAMLDNILSDDETIKDVLDHRNTKLNSEVPGMSEAGQNKTPTYDGQKEVEKAALEYKKNPNAKNRQRYIDIAAEVGAERFPHAKK